MRRCVVAFVCVSEPLATAVGLAQRATQPAIDSSRGGQLPPAAGPSGIEVASLDRQADPCVDFYEFACGGWRATHSLLADSGNYGRVQEIRDRKDALLRRIVERPQLSGDLRKAADHYAACVDTRTIEATAPLRTDFARIDSRAFRGSRELVQDVCAAGTRDRNFWPSFPLCHQPDRSCAADRSVRLIAARGALTTRPQPTGDGHNVRLNEGMR